MTGRIGFAVLVAALLGVLLVPDVGAARAPADARVSAGSPSTPYARSMQNEPAVAIDPMHPNIVAAGGNDLIDEAPCVTVYCAFFNMEAPVKRMGAMHVPIPFSPPLEDVTVPTEQTVFEAARKLCGKA